MALEFPGDPACEALDRQYMLGPSLLVAPVFSGDGEVSLYLPDGRWTHLLTGAVVEGGHWRKEVHDFLSLPLYARPNSLIAWGGRDDRPDYDYADGAIFAAYGLDERAEASAAIVDAAGAEVFRLTIRRDGAIIDAIASVADTAWTLRLPAGLRVSHADGAAGAIEDGGKTAVNATGSVRIVLA